MSQEQKTERLWSPLFVFIIVATLCCFMVGQGLNSGTSVYLDRMGQGAALAGALAAVFSASAAIARVACGPVIDNLGRVIVMVVGTLFLLAGTILPAFAPGTIMLAACRVLQGVGFSAATTASATAASDVLPSSRLGEGIGYYGLGQALAMSIGPALALFLVNTDPAENLYLGMSATAALALAFALLCRYENNPARLPETSSFRQRFESADGLAGSGADGGFGVAAGRIEDVKVDKAGAAVGGALADGGSAPGADERADRADGADGADRADGTARKKGILKGFFEPRALPGMLPMLFLSPAFGFGIFFMGLYGTSLGYAGAGLFYTVSAVAMIAVRLVSRAFMDRVAPFKIMTFTVIFGLIGFAMVFFGGQSELLFYAAGVPYGLCLGIAIPLNQSVAVKNTPAERWGAANAIYLLASDVGIGVASAIWGIVNEAAGFSVTIVCAMVCIAASLAIAWLAYPGHGLKPMVQR